jgi:hypothetical protein
MSYNNINNIPCNVVLQPNHRLASNCVCGLILNSTTPGNGKCVSNYHKCVCYSSPAICRSLVHVCSCSIDIDNCLALTYSHLCTCKIDPSLCKAISKFTYRDRHDCICRIDPSQCRKVLNHVCICKNNKLLCKYGESTTADYKSVSKSIHTCKCSLTNPNIIVQEQFDNEEYYSSYDEQIVCKDLVHSCICSQLSYKQYGLCKSRKHSNRTLWKNIKYFLTR